MPRPSMTRGLSVCTVVRHATALPFVIALAGCSSPVGNGVGPVSLGLAAASGTEVTVQGVTRVYQCFQGGITATLYFSDGSTGDFTGRVTWTSSNPSVVRVSNGELAAPDGSGFYAAGALVPVAAGNAMVTAEYSSIKAQMPVSVGVPTNFTIRRVDQSVPVAVDATSLGTNTRQQFEVTAVTDGVEKNVSTFAKWSIGTNIASVSASGLVTALGAGGPTPLTASFLNCTNTARADLTIANITGIRIAPEFGSDPLQQINSEKINVIADLDNGAQQDVSLQAVLKSTDTTLATFITDGSGANILQPLGSGAVTVQATLNDTYTAPDQIVNIVSSTLNGITVSPARITLRAGSDEVAYFKATGTFDNGQTQDVTRAVTWAVTDATLAAISNAKATAGFATPGSSLVGQTTVTATPPASGATATVSSATLTVDSVANPASGP